MKSETLPNILPEVLLMQNRLDKVVDAMVQALPSEDFERTPAFDVAVDAKLDQLAVAAGFRDARHVAEVYTLVYGPEDSFNNVPLPGSW